MMDGETFETSDMCLVAALRHEGERPTGTRWEGGRDGTCHWKFDKTDGLQEVVGAFFTGSLRVEPREFNQLFWDTKREFYGHYDRAKAS